MESSTHLMRILWVGSMVSLMTAADPALSQTDLVTNQLPNPEFRGTTGAIIANASGQSPALWRTFAIGTDSATTAIVPVAADELFDGSPPVNAVQLTVSNFGPTAGDDSAFDSSPISFTLRPQQTYRGVVYLRSANVDMSPQSVTISLPIFDAGGTFTGDANISVVNATSTWTRFEGDDFSTSLSGASAEFSVRVNEGAADNSVMIAWPEVAGPTLENRVPNPEFIGTGGDSTGNVTGDVPDFWRAFGLDSEGASIDLQTVPLAADDLYPGSPATNAIRVSTQVLAGAGFDHQNNVFSLKPGGYNTWGLVYVRADNADNSDQGVSIALPLFDPDDTSPGAPGSIGVNVGTEWNYYGGPAFSGSSDQRANIAFRLTDSGPENAVLIALPKINYPSDALFSNGYEGDDPTP